MGSWEGLLGMKFNIRVNIRCSQRMAQYKPSLCWDLLASHFSGEASLALVPIFVQQNVTFLTGFRPLPISMNAVCALNKDMASGYL